ncbi:hypothetical protein BJ973_002738 [Actinoplanes tereljensis]|uniref:Uncharacterized protein n=1 Tax=Paractinoplanes tereljensis TaxID=571912 RepID=A0A919TVK1_9ACTN|nr:hypothetical protein [Actinoplanes tereljensis]GIF22415.1 hypothetical protein Ate02nite_51450 [Actinoplanes tereljensis]
MTAWVPVSRWLWLFLAATLVQFAQLLQRREVVPYIGTLAIAALVGHVVSWGGRPLSPLPGLAEPQLAGLGGLASLMTAAAVVDQRNGGYGWPAAFGPASGPAAILPAVLAAVLLPIAVIGTIKVTSGTSLTSRQRRRQVGVALLPGFALSAGLLGAAAGVPMRTADAPVLVCVSTHTRTQCAVPAGALLVTTAAHPEPEMDGSLRQFVATANRVKLFDDMRSFAQRAGCDRLRAAVTGFLESGITLIRIRALAILGEMDMVCRDHRVPTVSRWMVDEPIALSTADRFAVDRWLADSDSALVFDLKVTSYLPAETVSRANGSAALEAALLLVGLGLVVRRVWSAGR